MRVLAAILLLSCLALLWFYVRRDLTEYASFKLLTETADRQRRYLTWARKSFLLFACTAIACLAILGRLRTLKTLPPEFNALADQLRAMIPAAQVPSAGFMVGFGGALLAGLLGGIIVASMIAKKRNRNSGPIMIGDIESLLPRNAPETACTALLSLNAGLCEELFFRLLLPLLLTLTIGNATAAFAIAAFIFGLAHIYQGAIGVIATTILGLVFTGIYLWTGSLWIAMCVHAGFDLIGLVIRPTITRAFAARFRS
jgi:membrane protease YdiL (CAAX protease family)